MYHSSYRKRVLIWNSSISSNNHTAYSTYGRAGSKGSIGCARAASLLCLSLWSPAVFATRLGEGPVVRVRRCRRVGFEFASCWRANSQQYSNTALYSTAACKTTKAKLVAVDSVLCLQFCSSITYCTYRSTLQIYNNSTQRFDGCRRFTAALTALCKITTAQYCRKLGKLPLQLYRP